MNWMMNANGGRGGHTDFVVGVGRSRYLDREVTRNRPSTYLGRYLWQHGRWLVVSGRGGDDYPIPIS